MPGARTPNREPRPPKGLLGYLTYRLFNLHDKIVPGAEKDWQTTIRAIVLMLLAVWCPVLTLVGLVGTIAANQGGRVWQAGAGLATEYGVSAAQMTLAVVACGGLTLLVRLAVRKARARSAPRTSAERPTLDQDEMRGPVNPGRTSTVSTAVGSMQNERARIPRQDTERDRNPELDQPR